MKTILLDVDGTLIDSNDAHTRAWIEALEQAGFEPKYPAIRKKIGMGGDHLLPNVTGIDIDEAEGKAISEARAKIFKEKYLPKLRAFQGARELLLKMREEGYQLIIATSAPKSDLDGLLKQAGLDDLDIPAATSSDADSSKPNPDIILAALEKAGAEPSEAIMIGDTPYDLTAAKKAGVRSIAFTCGGWMRDDLHEAAAVYESAADLLKRFDESILGAGHEEYTRRAS